MGYDGCDSYEPDDADIGYSRYLALLGEPDHDSGHWADPELDRLARDYDWDFGELHEMFRAVLFLRGWRLGQRIPWPPEAVETVRVLLVLLTAARCDTGPHLSPGGDDLTRVQSSPLVHARATLTAAPPARVPCPAGTTG